jgi:hypothetical protein
MSSYQRYLRERKEVQIEEQDLEEKAPIKGQDLKTLTGLVKADRAAGKTGGIGTGQAAGQAAVDLTKKQADRRAAFFANKEKEKLSKAAGVPQSVDVKPFEKTKTGSTEEPEASVAKDDKKPEVPSMNKEISGNTLSELLKSAGVADPSSSISKIKAAVEKALAADGGKFKLDPSFMV